MGLSDSRVGRVLASIPDWLVTYMPGPVGRQARYYYWKARMRSLGTNVTFGVGVQIANPEWMSIGDNSWIDDSVIMLAGPPDSGRLLHRRENKNYGGKEGEINIGKNCHIAQHVTLQGHGGLFIGDDSGVASGARVYTLSHHYRSRGGPDRVYKFSPCSPVDEQSLIVGPVVLSRWTAVGLNAVILPGVTLGEGTWVAALAMVTGDLPAHVVAGGAPARVIKQIRTLPR